MQPPHDIHAEQAVLATLALRPEIADDVAAHLPADGFCFFDRRHNALYQALLNVARRGEAPDWVIVNAELERLGLARDFKGAREVEDVVSAICEKLPAQWRREGFATIAQYESYVTVVQRHWVSRGLINNMGQIAELLRMPGKSIHDALHELTRAGVNALAQAHNEPMHTYGELAEDLYMAAVDRASQAADGGKPSGLPMGIPGLSEMLGGLPPGWVMLLGAPTGGGKSTAAMQMAANIARSAPSRRGPDAGGVYIASLEMLPGDLAGKVLYGEAGLDSLKVRSGELDDDDLGRMEMAFQKERNLRLFIDRLRAPSWPLVRGRMILARERFGVEACLLDYIQRLPAPRGQKKNEYYPEVMSGLKDTAEAMGIPIVCAAQLTRMASKSKKAPTKEDLGDASSLEKDADLVVLLHNRGGKLVSAEESEQAFNAHYDGGDKPHSIDVVDVIVAKHRFGRTGTVTTHFNKTLGRFEAPPKPTQQSFVSAAGPRADWTEKEPTTVFDVPGGIK